MGGAINLTCNQPDKMLKVTSGVISIVDAPLTFTIDYYGTLEVYEMDPDMTWAQWGSSAYNTKYPNIETDSMVILRWSAGYAHVLFKEGVEPSDYTAERGDDKIQPDMVYHVSEWQ